MSFFDRFKDKRVILLGAGVSNMPLAKMLAQSGAFLEIRDKKSEVELGEKADELKALGASLVLGEDYLKGMAGDYLFRSPGFRPDMPEIASAIKSGTKLVSEMELFIENAPCSVVGITGSDGKSTTTTLVSLILEAEKKPRNVFLGGNIGEPLLHRVDDMKDCDVAVAELSSFQLMTINSPVKVAAIKNITPNHLNWHTGMDEYIYAKSKILEKTGCAILNYDDENTRKLGESCQSPVIWFSRNDIPADFLKDYAGGVYIKDGVITYYRSETCLEEKVIPVEDILLPGGHNAENYATAIAAVIALEGKVPSDAIESVAKTFGGVRHRLELCRVYNGIKFYNSSIDSSPTRTAAAISALTCPIRIICGGYDKNIPYEPLSDALIDCENIKTVVLTGATAGKIKKALTEHPGFENSGIELIEKDDFKEAVISAKESADEGDAVLLSPASASFDRFSNFEERGNFFKQIVSEF